MSFGEFKEGTGGGGDSWSIDWSEGLNLERALNLVRSWVPRPEVGTPGDTMCGESGTGIIGVEMGKNLGCPPPTRLSFAWIPLSSECRIRGTVWSGQEELLGFGMYVCLCVRARLLCVSVLFWFPNALRRLADTCHPRSGAASWDCISLGAKRQMWHLV